jgi:hypothetical protein
MVSPLAKDDGGVTYIDSRAAALGEAITYFAPGSFAEPKSALLEGRYLSRREAGGWSTQNISPPFTQYKAAIFQSAFGNLLFTPELSRGVLESWYTPLVSGEPVGYVNLYLANTETGSYEAVTTVTPQAEYKPFTERSEGNAPEPEGASSDLSHVVFQFAGNLCCGASPKQLHVYEWADGNLRLVDVPPEHGKLEGNDNVGSAAVFSQPDAHGNPWRAVSGDGSRIVFTGGEETQGEFEGQVYVRENPMSTVEGCSMVGGACTVEVSASQRTNGKGEPEPDPNAGKNPLNPPVAWYRDASTDGSRVFFTSRVELTNEAYTGKEDNAANLYECELVEEEAGHRIPPKCDLTDLTVPMTAAEKAEDPDGAAVLGLVTASEDGSYVYFVAEGKLTEEHNAGGEEPVAGKPNLYLSHAGRVTFIATLAPDKLGHWNLEGTENGDEEDWFGEEGSFATEDFDFGPGQHSARVTSDGTVLAFESELGLTKFDTRPAVSGECEDERCREVYLYDAVTGKLVCVSCDPPSVSDPSGARPVGPAKLGGREQAQEGAFADNDPFYLPRNLSESGGRLFFQSPDALVPHDSNGLLNVYEWERVGEGSCTTASMSYAASHEGCTFPVSNVAGGFDSHFMDASVSGNDVFIATADRLVPSDTDSREDVYDARVEGGFPVSVAPAVCVSADSCKPPVSLQPGVFGAPASATFAGPGNPTPPLPPVVVRPKRKVLKCPKSKRVSHGRCVRKKKATRAERVTRRAGS